MSDKKKAHFKSRASSFLDDIVHCFKYPEAPPEVYKVLSKSVPKFLYFSDFADINGNVNLRKYIEFQDNPEEVELNSLEQEDLQHKYKTLKNLFSLLRVNPENVLESGSVRRSAIEERLRKRAHELICPGWTQKIAIRLRFDGEQAMVLVSDIYDGQTVNETLLAQRSKGFRTFFSFFINCGANNSGDLDNSTLLLDEPGLHLHADQQGKFLDILEAKSRTHTVLYSSHSPWMLPEDALNGILAVEKSQDKGTQVVSDWWARSRDSSQTIRKALGITRRDNIAFPGRQYIVAVEGPSDVIYLETMANALRKKDKTYVDKLAFAFQAAGGSGQLPARVASARQEAYEDVLLLVDSDTAGRKAKNQVLKKGILDVNKVLEVSEISGNPKKDAEIEDLIPSKEFTKVTNDYMTKVMNVPNREKITAKEVAEYKKSHRNAGNWETHEALVKKRKAKNSTYSKVSIAEHFAHMYISGALVFSDLMLKPFISLIEFFSSAVEH
jgi:5S rRNA maturation endonuclease (ribonuclease M5)